MVSYVGQSIRDNTPLSPSIVVTGPKEEESAFIRGDGNEDGLVDISDPSAPEVVARRDLPEDEGRVSGFQVDDGVVYTFQMRDGARWSRD